MTPQDKTATEGQHRKKYETNAERQRAYRERQRNAKKPIVTRIAAEPKRVTGDSRFADPRYMYIGDFGFGPCFAYVVQPEDRAKKKGPWPEGAAAVINFGEHASGMLDAAQGGAS